jgi:hypothetical protein
LFVITSNSDDRSTSSFEKVPNWMCEMRLPDNDSVATRFARSGTYSSAIDGTRKLHGVNVNVTQRKCLLWGINCVTASTELRAVREKLAVA